MIGSLILENRHRKDKPEGTLPRHGQKQVIPPGWPWSRELQDLLMKCCIGLPSPGSLRTAGSPDCHTHHRDRHHRSDCVPYTGDKALEVWPGTLDDPVMQMKTQSLPFQG